MSSTTGFTGLGSLPGTDFAAAVRLVLDVTPDLAFVPELPARGPWAGILGRGLALLPGFGASFEAGGWRLSDAAGSELRRARATWRDDLDRLEEIGQGFDGRLKVAVAGPWTLAAATGLAHTGTVLADVGARRDVAAGLADGVGDLLADVARRLPAATLVLQVDEPALPRVLAGGVPTPGGFFRHRAVDAPEAAAALAGLAAEPGRRGLAVETVLHCCAAGAPVGLLTSAAPDGAGFDAVSLDGDLVGGWDDVAGAVEAGRSLYLGVQPTGPGSMPLRPDELTGRAVRWLRPLELGPAWAGRLVLTPACGLAGFAPRDAAQVLRNLGRAAPLVAEELAS